MSAHTPGPWVASKHAGWCVSVKGAGTLLVCGGQSEDPPENQAAANARLIAAAPELLEALKAWSIASWLAGVAPDIDSNDPFASMLAQTHAAIAKAEGRS